MTFPPVPRIVLLTFFNIIIAAPVLTLLRLSFYYYFRAPDTALAIPLLVEGLYLGAKFDMRLLLLLFLPLILLGWIKPVNPFDKPLGRRVWIGYLTFIYCTIGLFYILDFAHFAYLEARLDATLVRFLHNWHESFHMVIQTYPVVPLLILIILLVVLTAWGQHRLIKTVAGRGLKKQKRWKTATALTVIALVYAFGIYGKFSWYPLRWSDAFFSNNAFASSIALNPVLYFYDTMKNKEVNFDREQAIAQYDVVADYLGVTKPDKENMIFLRRSPSKRTTGSPPNIVIVMLESFGYYKTGLSGNPLDPTPNFDRIAAQGTLFRRFYTPHNGTARSVFAAVTGIPDIELVETSSRNPLVVRQHVIANEMKNYTKFYFLGGSASWGEIRGLLSTNIEGLRIYEEGSYSAPRIDVWGISDLDLFKEANKVLKDAGPAPFLAIIQTSGNHRPYTIPENNDNFQTNPISDETARRYGFRNSDAYNAYRFMDHSIGRLIEIAAKEPYFDNTIFLFFGDHGLVRNAEHRPKYEHELLLNWWHVPLLIYSPKLLPSPRIIDTVASEVDVMPTVAGLAGVEYTNTTFGRDLFDPQFNENRFAFSIIHRPVPQLGLIGSDFYYQVNADGKSAKLFKLDPEAPIDDRAGDYPEIADRMHRLCLGLYETARYVRYNNAPEDIAGQIVQK